MVRVVECGMEPEGLHPTQVEEYTWCGDPAHDSNITYWKILCLSTL